MCTADEEELVRFLLGCAAIGYARSRKEVIALMQRIMEGSGILRLVTNGWWESFCRHHPNDAEVCSFFSRARAAASDPDALQRYFDLLQQTIDENALGHQPAQIFNVNESGMPLGPKAPLLICEHGTNIPSA